MSKLMCGKCGDPAVGEVTEIYDAVQRATEEGFIVELGRPLSMEFGRCADCAARLAVASQIVEQHPRVRVRLGNLPFVADELESVLAVLSMLGMDVSLPAVERLIDSDPVLWGWLELASVAGAIAFRQRFAPILLGPAAGDWDGQRWGWVTPEDRETLGQAVARQIYRRIEVPELMPPPNDGLRGCGFCGRSHILVKPSLASRTWGLLRDFDPARLGGEGSVLRGYLCPVCRAYAPPVGMGANPDLNDVKRALLAFLDALGKAATYDVDGLKAWAAIPDAEPGEPWAWADLEGLREELHPNRTIRYLDPYEGAKIS